MVNVAVEYYDRVEYTLEHKTYGPIIIIEPLGWKDDEKEYERVDPYDGIFTKFSNNITLVGNGAQYARVVYQVYGPNTELTIKKRVRHPQTNRWELAYFTHLDLMTYEWESNQVNIKANGSVFEELIKSRESEKVEIERLDTLDGNPLPELPTNLVNQEGRRIFLISDLKGAETSSSNFSNTTPHRSPIMDIASENDVHVQPVVDDFIPYTTGTFDWDKLNPTAANMFYYANDRDKTLRIIGNFRVRNYPFFEVSNFIDVGLVITDSDENVVSGQYVYQSGINTGVWRDISFEVEIDIEEGQGLMLVLTSQVFPSGSGSTIHNLTYERADLRITEDSVFPATITKVVMAHELGQRLTQITTSRDDAFYSEALGRTDIGYEADGVNTGALNGYAHGQWIRGFDKLPIEEDNKYKAFTTSFKDFIEHNRVAWNLNIGIEKIGFKERIRMEERKFFFNRNTTGHIGYKDDSGKWIYPRVNNLKRSVADDYFYNSLIFGYEKGTENEEAMGLDEPNGKTNFTTPITKTKNVYEMVSKYIAASYPKEFIRRKPKDTYPTTDHQNDKEIFPMDLKRGLLEVFEERKWEDDFETEPTGIFSPETATNLRLSPVNLLVRHGWIVVSGLIKQFKETYLKYGSSDGNSTLVTKPIGGVELNENGIGDTTNVVKPSELETPRFEPEWLEFEFPCDYQMIQQVEGSTLILGKKIPNFYGLWQFRNDEGDLEKGFLFNLKPNGSGQWKLLKSK